MWKTRGGGGTADELPARRLRAALAHHRPVGHGHAGERHHLPLRPRPGLRGRDALRAVLLRTAARDGDHQRHLRPHLLPAERLHRLRVPGVALRPEDAPARRVPLPHPARAGLGHHPLRARHHPLGHPRLAARADHPGHGRARHPLHGDGWLQGGQPDPEAADGGDAGRHGRGRDRHRVAIAGARVVRAGRGRRGSARPHERGQLRLQPPGPLQHLVRPHRRLLPGAVVLRHRPVPGGPLPDGPFHHREPSRAAVQRRPEDSDAVPDPLRGDPRLRFLPVHRAAPALQPAAACAGPGDRARGRVRGNRDEVGPGPGRQARRGRALPGGP